MTKYHISKNRVPAICNAKESCPLGGESSHFSSKNEAQKYSDVYNEILNSNNFTLIKLENPTKEDIDRYNAIIEKVISEKNAQVEENRKTIKEAYRLLEIKNGADELKEVSANLESLKSKITPNYLTQGDLKGPKEIIQKHSLINKFGPNKNTYITDPNKLTERNLNWINHYKSNPNDVDHDLKILKNNMINYNNFNEEYVKLSKKEKELKQKILFAEDEDLNNFIENTAKLKNSIYELEKESDALKSFNENNIPEKIVIGKLGTQNVEEKIEYLDTPKTVSDWGQFKDEIVKPVKKIKIEIVSKQTDINKRTNMSILNYDFEKDGKNLLSKLS